MPRLLRMPAVATGSVDAVLREWIVPEGAAYSARDVIATLETDKAAVDMEADTGGTMLRALVPEGATVEVGSPIAVLADPGERIDDVDAALATLGMPGTPPAPPESSHAPGPRPAPPDGSSTAMPGGPHRERLFISPLARRLARDAGLQVDRLVGTGPGGRIVRRDVAAAIADAAAASTADAKPDQYRDIPHPRARQVIAARLTQSQATPHFYLRGSCRADALLAAREQLNAVSPERISVNDLLVKAAARALMLVPAMNVIWLPHAIRSYSTADISIAIATERGVVAPIVRSVEDQTIAKLATNVRDLVARANSGTLRQEELDGGTFGITNLGMFGTEEFAAIINPPQSAILAVGAARPDAVVDDGALVVATVMHVTLSVDHRAIDGAVAADWMRTFVSLIEHPVQIFA